MHQTLPQRRAGKPEGTRMPTTLHALSRAAILIVGLAVLASAARAADWGGEPHAVHRKGRDWRWLHYHWAPSQLVAGVRGASPLTVPFVGYNWYPGPVYYYGPPPGSYCCAREDSTISVRY